MTRKPWLFAKMQYVETKTSGSVSSTKKARPVDYRTGPEWDI